MTPRKVRRAQKWTEEIVSWPEEPGRHMVYYEDDLRAAGSRILTRIEHFTPYNEGYSQFVEQPVVADTIAQLFGEEPVLFKDKINFKCPGGDGFKAHQDVQAGWSVYAQDYISMLVSIDRSDVQNGCLEVARTNDRKAVAGKTWEPLSEEQVDALEFEPLETRPGDVVFFDSYAPHRSGPNLSDQPRRILFLTFNPESQGDHREQYFADKRASYPPDCERDPDKTYKFRV